MLRIYHNPRCRKSREALQIIEEKGETVEVVEYLKTPPTKDELRKVVEMLGIPAEDLVRKNEDLYKESYKGKDINDEDWLVILSENPKLIERPIIIKEDQAVIGRPPEKVNELL
ncbi:MAG: arsenate reductase (glutaredoxin) [Candidatus Cyclobacteriaceae bacterium M2_1C_046]